VPRRIGAEADGIAALSANRRQRGCVQEAGRLSPRDQYVWGTTVLCQQVGFFARVRSATAASTADRSSVQFRSQCRTLSALGTDDNQSHRNHHRSHRDQPEGSFETTTCEQGADTFVMSSCVDDALHSSVTEALQVLRSNMGFRQRLRITLPTLPEMALLLRFPHFPGLSDLDLTPFTEEVLWSDSVNIGQKCVCNGRIKGFWFDV